MHRRGLYFGERMLSSVLRPRFITPEQYRYLQDRVGVLLRALDKTYRRAIADDAFRAQFGLFEWEEELIRIEPGFRDASPVSRLDAFFVHERGGLRFTEYNAETPAAASYNDVLADVFLGLPIMREFLRSHEVRPQPSRHNLLHALLDAYHQWSGTRAAPVIAIVDWREVPTYSEFVITKQYFETQGLTCIIADPRELDYRGGRLYAGGQAIDLIYKRVLISELVERGGLEHPVIRAVRERAVCMVNPFRCKILHKKLSLAVLSDERNASMYSLAEHEAIESHIPWTRRVEERHSNYHGKAVDLVPFAMENREHLVLKPNDEYGGTGIVLGWEVTAEAWQQAVHDALQQPFIMQERITLPTEAYPIIVDGTVRIEDRILDTAPFVFYGGYMDGLLTRLSTESLVNVTAGGGSSVATFLVARR
jgi:glutathionylspermidine synthase